MRHRADFDRLRAEGRRFAAGLTWCVARPDAVCIPPRVAFGISRAVGSAPVRNRIRRRLRVLVANAALPPGDYLFGASAAAAVVPFAELEQMIGTLATRCRQAGTRS